MGTSEPRMIDDIARSLQGDPQTVEGECAKHGAWTLETFTKYPDRLKTCPGCGAEAAEARVADEIFQRAKAEHDRRLRRLYDAGVGNRHINKTFEAFVAENTEQAAALDRCRSVVAGIQCSDKRIPSLILCGNPGTGKSHLGCAMVIAVSDAGHTACRISVADLVRDFKATWAKGAEHTETDLLDWYGDVSLLVIEEIGVQHGSDTERMFLFEVMNRRYENCLPTVLVSNLDAKKLGEEVGERVMDRLREDGGKLLKFTGESWRKA